jgi:hypothetical protein
LPLAVVQSDANASSKSDKRLTLRCSEPGHHAVVATHVSRGPGR